MDVVALAAVMPSGKLRQILPAVDIVLPGPLINEPHYRVAQKQPSGLPLRHHGDHRAYPLLRAVFLDEGQGRVHIPLRPGHREIKLIAAVNLIAYDEAICRLTEGRVQHTPPHELHAHRVLAQAIVTIYIIGSQFFRVLRRDRFKNHIKCSPEFLLSPI